MNIDRFVLHFFEISARSVTLYFEFFQIKFFKVICLDSIKLKRITIK